MKFIKTTTNLYINSNFIKRVWMDKPNPTRPDGFFIVAHISDEETSLLCVTASFEEAEYLICFMMAFISKCRDGYILDLDKELVKYRTRPDKTIKSILCTAQDLKTKKPSKKAVDEEKLPSN